MWYVLILTTPLFVLVELIIFAIEEVMHPKSVSLNVYVYHHYTDSRSYNVTRYTVEIQQRLAKVDK